MKLKRVLRSKQLQSFGQQGTQTSQGNQPWILIGRSDAEAKAPKLWLCDVKSWLIGKDPDIRKDWEHEEKRLIEDEMVG